MAGPVTLQCRKKLDALLHLRAVTIIYACGRGGRMQRKGMPSVSLQRNKLGELLKVNGKYKGYLANRRGKWATEAGSTQVRGSHRCTSVALAIAIVKHNYCCVKNIIHVSPVA